jgi:hypothetical protein
MKNFALVKYHINWISDLERFAEEVSIVCKIGLGSGECEGRKVFNCLHERN